MTTSVSQIPFPELLEQWEPKIHKLGKWYIPYLESEDIKQELRIILWKCQQQYREDTEASFHTYLDRAMRNQLYKLTLSLQKHHPDWGGLLYLSSLLSTDRIHPMEAHPNLVSSIEFSPVMALEMEGFTPLEIGWTLGRADHLNTREIASLTHSSLEEVRQAAKTSKRKIEYLRKRGRDQWL